VLQWAERIAKASRRVHRGGFPVPDDLASLAASAIIAFAYKNKVAICPVELRPYHGAFAAGRFHSLDCG
jgi:hypothetical protein